MQILLSNNQAGPGRTVKQEQEEDFFSALYMKTTKRLLNYQFLSLPKSLCAISFIALLAREKRYEGETVSVSQSRMTPP